MISESLFVALAGFASFASPCVLPLALPFVVYIGAVTVGQSAARWTGAPDTATAVSGAALGGFVGAAFAIGFGAVFVARGAGATTFGDHVQGLAPELTWLAGATLMLAGLHHVRVLIVPLFPSGGRLVGLGAVLVGAAFVFGWTPCAGPVLSAALTLASSSATVPAGLAYLILYAGGLGLAFVVVAVLVAVCLGNIDVQKRTAERALGLGLIGSGVALVTGFLPTVGQWLLVTAPALGRLESLVTPDALPALMMQRGSGL